MSSAIPDPDDPRLRCLLVTPFAPLPAHDGGRQRVLHLAAGLAARGHEVSIFALDDGTAGPREVTAMRERGVELTLVPHSPRWPMSIANSIATGRSLYAARFHSRRLRAAVARRVEAGWVDTVQCEYGYMAGYLPGPSGTAPAGVLDEHNLEWELAGSGRTGASARAPLYRLYAAREQRLRRREERSAALRAARVLTVSGRDRRLLMQLAPTASVSVIPNGVDIVAFDGPIAGTEDPRPAVLFVGKLDYGPNIDGLTWFVDEVWPHVMRRHPAARFSIVGRDPVPPVRALADAPGVEVVGPVPDTRPHLERATVSVVPLRRGGGTRLKIVEALAAGLAVVSTHVGAEGLDLPPGAIAVNDDPVGFADEVGDLLQSPERRREMATRGGAHVRERLAWASIVETLEGVHRHLARERRRAARSHREGRLG